MPGNRIVALGFRFRIAQAFGKQLSGTFHRVLLLRDVVAAVIKQARQRFAGGLPVHAVLYAARQSRYQRGAFDQSLRVDDGIITLRLYRLAEGFAFGFNRGREPRFPPAANRHRDHAVNRFMPGGDLREALFHHPVKTNTRYGLHGIRQ